MFPRVTAHALRLVHRRTMENGWVVSVFSVPESDATSDTSYTTLSRLGFGTAALGVWIAPGHLTSETREVLERR